MNAAECVIRTAETAGVELCFANPGTTEMPLVLALDGARMRCVLGLHETICTGAADGYGRLSGKPALTLLHLGPGLANGLANLHNARRARTPMVNLVGEHASWHRDADAPLTMDIEALARTVSRWTARMVRASEAGSLTAEAITRARAGRGGVATLVLPHDLLLEEVAEGVPPMPRYEPAPAADPGAIAAAAELLRGSAASALFLGGPALWGEGLRLAGRIARATGAVLVCETGFARLATGAGRPPVRRLPYFPEQAQALLDGFAHVIGCGAKPPVSFFGWPGKPSRYLDDREGVIWMAGTEEDAVAALRELADALGAREDHPGTRHDPPPAPTGPLDGAKLAAALVRELPEDAVVVPTAVTNAYPFSAIAERARPHEQLALTGGAIGEGPALAIGAALAAPGRRVINLEADGSGAYALQALWTQARERLDILTIVCANRAYRILRLELERSGQAPTGRVTRALTSLEDPPIDWVQVARGLGVPGIRVDTGEALVEALRRALAEPGPCVIEAVLS
ncbi:MAG: acetolactate synthase large subunit [Geminicoccaceae bacterium]|nr:acetolactate synthase large subunit [Geminicoccaceae bacterium]MDW8340770.1 acetolactate synthase large subunit [Geminicoccaceae bacterium]